MNVYGFNRLAVLGAVAVLLAVRSAGAVDSMEAQKHQLAAAVTARAKAAASFEDLRAQQLALTLKIRKSSVEERSLLKAEFDELNSKLAKTRDRLSAVEQNVKQLERVTGVVAAPAARVNGVANEPAPSRPRFWSQAPSVDAVDAYHRSLLGPFYDAGFEFKRGQRVLVFGSNGRLVGYSYVSRVDGEELYLKQKWYRSAQKILRGFAVPESSSADNYLAGTVVSQNGREKVVTATYANGAVELDGNEVIDAAGLRRRATVVRNSRFGACYDVFR